MRSVTVVRHDGSKQAFDVPKHMNPHFMARQLNKANRGEVVSGCTEREVEWIADAMAQLMEPSDPAVLPAESAR